MIARTVHPPPLSAPSFREEAAARRAERALHDLTARMQALLRSLHVGVLMEDEHGRVVLVNGAFRRAFGIAEPSAALLGESRTRTLERMRPALAEPDDWARRMAERTRDRRITADDEVRTADGRVWRADHVPLFAAGEYRGCLWTYRDGTAAVRAADALRESEARHRRLVEAASDIIYGTDAEGRFTYVNPVAERVLGRTRAELAALRATDLVRADQAETVARFYARQVRERRPDTYLEFPVQAADGREVWFGQCLHLLEENGRVVGTQAVARDVTARREVERMKDELVGVVSHELRTPLTSIRGSLSLLADGRLGVGDRERMVEVALQNTDRLIRLVNDFLDLERIRSGTVALVVDDHPLAPLVEQAMDAVRVLAADAAVDLRARVPALGVRADGDRLVQVLVNLLSNAVKFSPAGAVVRVTASTEPQSTRIDVTDHGRGIPPDRLESIFDRFQQVNPEDARVRGGAGLGLTICRGIVAQHGGTLTVRSRPGEGSVFTVRLPRRPRGADTAEAGQNADAEGTAGLETEDERASGAICARRPPRDEAAG